MSVYNFRDPLTFRAPAAQVDDSALYAIGTTAKATHPTYGEVELIYLKAGDTEAVGSVCTYSGDYITALAVAGAVNPIAVSLAIKAANQYGWYVIRGNVPVLGAALLADNAALYLTATPGTVDDAVVSGDTIFKARTISAIGTPSAGLAVAHVDYSFTAGQISLDYEPL